MYEHTEALQQVSDALWAVLKPELDRHDPSVILESLIDLMAEVGDNVFQQRVQAQTITDYPTFVEEIAQKVMHTLQQPLAFEG